MKSKPSYRLVSPDRLNLPENRVYIAEYHKKGYRMQINESEYIGLPVSMVENNPVMFARAGKVTEIFKKSKRPRINN